MSGAANNQAELERRYWSTTGTRPDLQRTLREVYGVFDEWVIRVGRCELFLSPLDGGWYYYDRTQDRTQHTGYRVGDVTFVAEGNGVRAVPVARDGDEASPHGRLDVLAGPGAGHSLSLSPETTIGRGEDNAIVLSDDLVSRHHSLIRWVGGCYVVTDLGSRNGTFVNGERIVAPAPLRPGDVITVGGSQLLFPG